MMAFTPWKRLRQFAEHESLRPDLGRAIRATFAVMVPVILATFGWLPLSLSFVAFAAQNVALVDVRGAYTVRLGLLLAMTAILAGAAQLGGMVTPGIAGAIAGAGFIALCGGVWRHLTPDYGTSLAISSTLLFLIAVSSPEASTLAEHPGLSALAGGLWGVLLQVSNWPIRPQHPLRRAVSDSWLAVAALFSELAPGVSAERTERIRHCETMLRTTLDQTYAALAAGGSSRKIPVRARLEELNLAAARLATRVVALNTALESAMEEPDLVPLSAALQPVLKALTNTSRSVAVAVVSRQPAHLAMCEVRLRRLGHLLRVFQDSAPRHFGEAGTATHLRVILRQIDQQLPAIHDALRATLDRADERAAFSLELFDLDTWTLRPLASALVLDRRIDLVLVRFTLRVAVLTMLGVAAFKFGNLPHGYWLPLTMVIVLQPDYGSTRQRAAQRVLGTFAGGVAASLLLWLGLPVAALTVATAASVFFFGFFIKRNYAVAVFFITLVVVLLTEANGPVSLWFTAERLGSTLAGGALALLAALFFWPVWERDRLPPILAAAIDTNRAFLDLIANRAREGGGYDAPLIAAKRHAESANSAVFSSLQRMIGDPRNRQEGLEEAAALANGNQRVTRAFTVMALHLAAGVRLETPRLASFHTLASATLDALASSVRTGFPSPALPTHVAALRQLAGESDAARTTDLPAAAILAQIPSIATELVAMTYAAAPAGIQEGVTTEARTVT